MQIESEGHNFIRPESELLLHCLSVIDDEVRKKHLEAYSTNSIDWNEFIEEARFHEVLHFAFDRMRKIRPDLLPADHFNNLQVHFQHNCVHNMFLLKEQLRLVQLFQSNHIPSLLYKGPLFVSRYYPHLGYRSFWDIDILIYKKDFDKTKQLLLNNHFRSLEVQTDKEEEKLLRNHNHYSFASEDGRFFLELHWDIIPNHSCPHGFDTQYLWNHAINESYGGSNYATLLPEELLLASCIHGGLKHEWVRLRYLCDLAQLIHLTPQMDWDRVIQHANQIGMRQTVLLGLFLVHSLLHIKLPLEIIQLIQHDKSIHARAGMVFGRLFRKEHGLPGFNQWLESMHIISKHSCVHQLKPSFLQSFRNYIGEILRPEFNDRMAIPSLPKSFSFMFYIARPVRLFKEHKLKLLNRLK